MPSAGVVHRYPLAMRQSGPQDITRLGDEDLIGIGQDAHHLPFGNVHAQHPQQVDQTRHRRLPLVVLGENKTLEFGTEVIADPAGQRRQYRAPIRRQPPLAAIAHHPRFDLEILDGKVLVPFEPGSRRNVGGGDDPLLDRHRRRLRPTSLLPPCPLSPLLCRLVHTGGLRWLDLRLALQAPQPRVLFSQRGQLFPQPENLFKEAERQLLDLIGRKSIYIWRWLIHIPKESRQP